MPHNHTDGAMEVQVSKCSPRDWLGYETATFLSQWSVLDLNLSPQYPKVHGQE